MRTVALISGGKDSCYNMIQCVAAGHQIVALANIQPRGQDDLDSYMYQTVGHHALSLYTKAMEIPLYQQSTGGIALNTDKHYSPTADDEVEDLYDLLKRVKNEMDIEAVAVGAILSDYQRIRVENVCNRLGLVSLAYLWRRNQHALLQEMIDNGVEAIIVKVAALGLEPRKHLGMTLSEIQPHLLRLHDKYGLNVCGEGGEYETFTLNCPLFVKKIVIDEKELVVPSEDPVVGTGYLNLTKGHVEAKSTPAHLSSAVKTPFDFVFETDDSNFSNISQMEARDLELEKRIEASEDEADAADENVFVEACIKERRASMDYDQGEGNRQRVLSTTSNLPSPLNEFAPNIVDEQDIENAAVICGNECSSRGGWWFCGGVKGTGGTQEATRQVLKQLCILLESQSLTLQDVCSTNLYVRDMEEYSLLNEAYKEYFNFPNPPTRVCVQCPFSESVDVILDAIIYRKSSDTNQSSENIIEKTMMHVQGVSHWAPANIGPYSQAFKVGELIGTSGQIALIPGTMEMLEGGPKEQCSLALRHIGRVISAIDRKTDIRSVLQGFCYTRCGNGARVCQRSLERRTAGALVECVTLPGLPKHAAVEWQAHANKSHLDYEETGCKIGNYKIAIKRRWNFENTVSAFVCHVATSSSPSSSQLSFQSEEAYTEHKLQAENMSTEELQQVLQFAIKKLVTTKEKVICDPAINIRIFYQVGASPCAKRIHEASGLAAQTCGARIACTALPALALHNHFTFLSISGLYLA